MLFAEDRHVVIAQSSIPQFEKDNDLFDKYYIPSRWAVLAALCKNTSIILPDVEAVRDMAVFLENTLAKRFRHNMRVFWTSGGNYLLDDDIAKELLPEIAALVDTNQANDIATLLVPYRANHPFLNWSQTLAQKGVHHIGDDEKFIDLYGNKTILHRNWNKPDESALFEGLNVNIPRGYVCDSLAELTMAYSALQASGICSVMIKPAHGSTGEGIVKASSLDDVKAYQWNAGGPFVIEEALVLDRDHMEREINCSIQFVGDRLLGKPTSQVLHGTHWQGNVVPGILPNHFAETAESQSVQLLKRLAARGLTGPGGFDFLCSKGTAYLVDPNIGRFTGAHVPKFLADKLAPEKAWATLEMPHGKHINDVWCLLQQNNLAFDFKSLEGVLPFCHLNNMWAMHIAFGNTGSMALEMLEQTRSILG